MSPEQAAGKQELVGPASDLHDPLYPEGDETVVATLYFLGRPPTLPDVYESVVGSIGRSATLTITDKQWKADLDIDSDNNNGTNFPDGSDWEELVEDHDYGIGKLVFPNSSHYTPMRLRLDTGFFTTSDDVIVRFSFTTAGQSGTIKLWNTFEADPLRSNDDAKDGGNRIFPNTDYQLSELKYDGSTGALTLWIEVLSVNSGHDKYVEVISNPKLDDFVKADLTVYGTVVGTDRVRYLAVNDDTFFPELVASARLKQAFPAHFVYDQTGEKRVGLKKLGAWELELLGFDPAGDVIGLIGEPASVPGFKTAVYRDYTTSGGQYFVSFAGTDGVGPTSIPDWMNNLSQGIGLGGPQYTAAMKIGREFQAILGLTKSNTTIVGHSLGGGLASAASVVSGFNAVTFNGAGLDVNTILLDPDFVLSDLTNYNSSISRITAYEVDYDVLSYLSRRHSIMPDPLSARVQLDGYYTDLIGTGICLIDQAVALIETVTGVQFPISNLETLHLGVIGSMATQHLWDAVFWGLMVNEWTGKDVFGKTFIDGDPINGS